MDGSSRVTIDFEVFTATRGPAPTRRTSQKRQRGVSMMRCTGCGDEAPLKDPRLAAQAAAIHARTAHEGARARVRSVPRADA